MIKIEALTKKYGKQTVLKQLSMEWTAGQSIALIGPNGSGKTTLIKTLMGLVLPDSGRILVKGEDISKNHLYRSNIGYMPQINRFPDHLTVTQLFTMMKKMRSEVSASAYDEELYQAFNLRKMNDKSLSALSGGMRQQLSAALAFLFDPSIIILDEPTAALDPLSNELLKEKINKEANRGKLVVTTSHILNDLDDIAHQVIYMMEGEVKFFKEIADLRKQTSESKLNKIIASVIKGEL
jgi:Cu-processing system ATP-binding protein